MPRNAFGRLTNPIQSLRHGPALFREVVSDSIERVLNSVGVDADGGRKLGEFLEVIASRDISSTRVLEARLKELLNSWVEDLSENVAGQLRKRAAKVNKQLVTFTEEHFFEGANVLDWGCGDGLIAKGLSSHCAQLDLLDIEDHRQVETARAMYIYQEDCHDASSLSGAYDIVLALTVLHHSLHPVKTVADLCSASKEFVLLLESTPSLSGSPLDSLPAMKRELWRYEYCGLVDWIYNRVICDDIQTPFNYLHRSGWKELFGAFGFECVREKTLGVDQDLVPEWHELMLFVRR